MNLFPPFKFILFFLMLSSSHTITFAADIEAGKDKAKNCFGCHGLNGQSTIPTYPKLAGQRARYLEMQLLAFQSGKRENMMMQHIASNLNKEQIKDLAAFFASQKIKNTDKNLDKQSEDKLAMCKGCHGNKLEGRGGTPRLATQHAPYLKKQLLNFKNKKRIGGPMNSIISSLSEQEISDLAKSLANY